MKSQITEFKPVVKIVSEEPEFHNMKDHQNMGYKLKITYENRSMSLVYHDSVAHYEEGKPLDIMQVLDNLANDYHYWNYSVNELMSEFGYEDDTIPKAILKEAEDIKRVFQDEDTIQKLKSFANGEDFNTENENSEESQKAFNDDKTKFFEGMDKDIVKSLKAIGMDNNTIGEDFEIELIPKKLKTTSSKDMFLLGVTKDNARIYLERGSWDCEWYYGFGYIETFDPQHSSHSHFEGFNAEKNQDLRSAFLEFFKGGKLTVTAKESWTLCELMQSFYQLQKIASLYHNGGGSGLTTNPVINENETIRKTVLEDIKKIIVEVQKMLAPKGANFEEIGGDNI